MPMREECKHFQSRTYAEGETVRFCVLDLAPEAPWRCPAGCPKYERRLADVGWVHGSLVSPRVEDEPDVAVPEAVDVLEEAEGIVNSAVPDAVSEVEREEGAGGMPGRSPAGLKPRRRLPWRRGSR